jgi:hypothetical protein
MGAGTVVAGILLLLFGLALTATIIGAVLGIPLLIIGIILIAVGAKSNPSPPMVYYQPQPVYYAPPPTPVNVYVQQTAQASPPPPPPPPQVMFRCRYCQTVYPETQGRCPNCGAGF